MAVRKFIEGFARKTPELLGVQKSVGATTRSHASAISSLEDEVLNGSVIIEDVALSTTASRVETTLGREWKGAIAVKGVPSGTQVVFEDSPNNDVWANVSVSAGTATVSILFF